MTAYTAPAIGTTQAETLGSAMETVLMLAAAAVRGVVLANATATMTGAAAAVAKDLTNLLAHSLHQDDIARSDSGWVDYSHIILVGCVCVGAWRPVKTIMARNK